MDATAARSIDAVRRFFRAYLRERNPERRRTVFVRMCVGSASAHPEPLGRVWRRSARCCVRNSGRSPVHGIMNCVMPAPLSAVRTVPARAANCCCPERRPTAKPRAWKCAFPPSAAAWEKNAASAASIFPCPAKDGARTDFSGQLGETTTAGMSFRSKEQAFELLKNSIPGGLIGGFMEPGFPLYFVNDNLIRHLGYDSYEEFAADIQGMVGNGIHPEDREHVNHVVSESLAVSDHYEVVYRMLAKGGSFIWVLDRGGLTTDRGRKVIVSIVIDITQQRRLQERLQRGMASLERKNAELGAFYQVVVSGIAKILDDPGYTLLYANDQFFDNLGYTRRRSSPSSTTSHCASCTRSTRRQRIKASASSRSKGVFPSNAASSKKRRERAHPSGRLPDQRKPRRLQRHLLLLHGH